MTLTRRSKLLIQIAVTLIVIAFVTYTLSGSRFSKSHSTKCRGTMATWLVRGSLLLGAELFHVVLVALAA